MTANHLSTNVSLLEKSTEAKSSRYERDEKVCSSWKTQGKKGKAPMGDLDRKAPESTGIIRESPGMRSIDKKWGLEMGVTVSMILRQTSDMEGARGTKL